MHESKKIFFCTLLPFKSGYISCFQIDPNFAVFSFDTSGVGASGVGVSGVGASGVGVSGVGVSGFSVSNRSASNFSVYYFGASNFGAGRRYEASCSVSAYRRICSC